MWTFYAPLKTSLACCKRHQGASFGPGKGSVISSAVAMESNKDEAERCIEIAIAALRDNQHDKARRFLEKAQKLFPTDKVKGACNVHTCLP